MDYRRVAVLGGGPGGLYAARLLKLAQPSCEVAVYERNAPDYTFGFGIGVSANTQDNLEAADPDTLHDIRAAGIFHNMSFRRGDEQLVIRNDRLFGIARTEILAILQRHAEKAGAELHFGSPRVVDELDADIVIASDGVNSQTRSNGDFGGEIEWGRGLYLWAGTDFKMDVAIFEPVTTEHGTWVTHAYPYQSDRSTFVVETDEQTWRNAGFDATTEALAWDESDTGSLQYLQDAFADTLGGRPLIGNRSRWLRFRTVTCKRWSSGRVVLLGDAAHTAHYSVGSGAKLAMEDAIALVDALTAEPDTKSALATYEARRRPMVEKRQELARRSHSWWDSYPLRTHLPLETLSVSFMTRTGNVSLEKFAGTNPNVVDTSLRHYGETKTPTTGRITDWVLAQPYRFADHRFPTRLVEPDALADVVNLTEIVVDLDDVWGARGDAVVESASAAREAGAQGFRFCGPPIRSKLLTRLDMAERVRLEVGGLIVVDAPASARDDLAAALVSGRVDLVSLTPEEAA